MNKITTIQVCFTYTLLSVASFLGIGIFGMLQLAKRDAYISVLISFLVSSIILFIFFKVWNYEPNLPFYEKTKKLFGKTLGTIINYIILILVTIILVSAIYNFLIFINTQLLTKTPYLILGIALTCVSLYLISKGIVTIFRLGVLLLTINLILFFTAAFNLFTTIEISNFFPILKDGISPVLNGALLGIYQFTYPIIFLLIIPKNKIINSKITNKFLFLSHCFSHILLFLFIFLILGNLGYEIVELYTYPEYMVFKGVELFGFIDRIENVLTTQWIFGYLFFFSFGLYFLENLMNYNFKLKENNKILITIISFVLLIISNKLFPNDISYLNFVDNISSKIKIIFIGIIILLFIAILIKKYLSNRNKIENV